MEFLEVIDVLREEDASVHRLFDGEGRGMHSDRRLQEAKRRANYQRKLVETAKFINEVMTGRRPTYHLQEALGTSDFPLLFGDILDRVLLGNYMDYPKTFEAFVRTRTVRDFRTVSRHFIDGAEGVLDAVAEQELYPGSSLSEGRYQYSVLKYGRQMPFSWESMINDDLQALRDIPERFGKAAARSEAKFVTQLYVDVNGPHASFYTVGNGNIITGNPDLAIDGLAAGIETIASAVDADGEPITIDFINLVVPPALEVTALNIMNATQLRIEQRGGVRDTGSVGHMELLVANWMTNRLRLVVDPYIPIVASTANGNTSWFLFGSPDSGRPAIEFGRLMGHETPEVFVKEPNARRVGGGTVNPMDGDFDRDGLQYKVRHVFGGSRMDPKTTVASNGSNT